MELPQVTLLIARPLDSYIFIARPIDSNTFLSISSDERLCNKYQNKKIEILPIGW